MSMTMTFPGRLVWGQGARREFSTLLPAAPVLIVCGRHAHSLVEGELLPLLAPRETAVVSDIRPELPIDDVERVLAAGRAVKASAVIGVGGGSAIDCAKAAAALLPLAEPVRDYFYGSSKITRKGAFFAALPTTAGTGAEVTGNAVLSDPETGIKQSLRGAGMTADLAIVDPELTYGAPARVTAASGFDALTQSIESFLSRKASAVTDALALSAAVKIYHHLAAACLDNHAARSEMAEGSMMTGLAFAASGLGAVHGIGHPLGSVCHIGHGETCALLLPHILRWNLPALPDKLPLLARTLGEADPETLIRKLVLLRRELRLREKLDAPLTPEQTRFIVANCRSGSMKCNPRDLSDDEVRQILQELA